VHDAGGVCRCEPVDELAGDVHGRCGRKGPLRHDRSKRAAAYELHRDIRDRILVPHGVNRDDIRVIETGRGTRFLFESAYGCLVIADRAENFQCHLPLQPNVSRPVHLAHAAGAEQLQDFISRDLDPVLDCARPCAFLERGALKERIGGVTIGKQRLHLAAQCLVAEARIIEKRRTVTRGPLQGSHRDRFDARPEVPGHFLMPVDSSRRSHIFAMRQSRMTVCGETCSASEISSTVRPPKKRSSTT
jgi:hypothetical protein